MAEELIPYICLCMDNLIAQNLSPFLDSRAIFLFSHFWIIHPAPRGQAKMFSSEVQEQPFSTQTRKHNLIILKIHLQTIRILCLNHILIRFAYEDIIGAWLVVVRDPMDCVWFPASLWIFELTRLWVWYRHSNFSE